MNTAAPSWVPDKQTVEQAHVTAFARWCVAQRGAPAEAADHYPALWSWSVQRMPEFWLAVWDYFDVPATARAEEVLSSDPMPNARWFSGARLNYVDQIFRDRDPGRAAVIDVAEPAADGSGSRERVLTWAELGQQVRAFAGTLRRLGVGHGDRVAGYLPNIAESVVAFLAAASIGAVWASCGQDYAPGAAADRFRQLEPTVLVVADGYRYAGKERDRRVAAAELLAALPSVEASVVIPRLGLPFELPGRVETWAEAITVPDDSPVTPVAFDHPLWILFSSGTTGAPKGIVHGHGGVLLEHLKVLSLHNDLGAQDTFFWYTTPSWMVWNYLISGLLVGSTIVCYDGSPTHPGADALFALAARHRVTFLGASPGYLSACEKTGAEPGRDFDLSALRAIGSSGSHLPAPAYTWVAEHVAERVQVVSTSGGTDIVSAFAGGVPTMPVWPGELSIPCLGVALDALDPQGRPLRGAMGELVVTRPMPSMPLYFWNDPDQKRYLEAYFSAYPGVWRHGDWITITDRGSVMVHGRSDSTLNRNGVRMGSADIYQAAEAIPEVAEALVIGAERPDGGYWMPLFVRLQDGSRLDDELVGRIRAAIREHASPRHEPDEIIAVPAIPHTRTGKKLEVPVKRLLQGANVADVADSGAVDDPASLIWYADYRSRRESRTQAPTDD
ncbi:acetoacetate--CoA ligase [Streptomyces sp. NPDC059909]|uniref:acetoacetate--CoA ligase n=1 Tax=Streptomyces sp. NPDC059909 TaxID=3346998 RepID=UPI003667FC24